MASFKSSKPSLLSWIFGAKPPSSPTLTATCYDVFNTILAILCLDDIFQVMVDFRSNLHSLSKGLGTSREDHKFLITYDIFYTCIANLFPAWDPPLITLKAGTGKKIFLVPAKSAKCLYNGTFFAAAPALAARNEYRKANLQDWLPKWH